MTPFYVDSSLTLSNEYVIRMISVAIRQNWWNISICIESLIYIDKYSINYDFLVLFAFMSIDSMQSLELYCENIVYTENIRDCVKLNLEWGKENYFLFLKTFQAFVNNCV